MDGTPAAREPDPRSSPTPISTADLRARAVTTGGAHETIDVAAGSVFFVPAREEHRFHDITEDLAVLVFFGPAEGTR